MSPTSDCERRRGAAIGHMEWQKMARRTGKSAERQGVDSLIDPDAAAAIVEQIKTRLTS